jgi:hypothetical protein
MLEKPVCYSNEAWTSRRKDMNRITRNEIPQLDIQNWNTMKMCCCKNYKTNPSFSIFTIIRIGRNIYTVCIPVGSLEMMSESF